MSDLRGFLPAGITPQPTYVLMRIDLTDVRNTILPDKYRVVRFPNGTEGFVSKLIKAPDNLFCHVEWRVTESADGLVSAMENALEQGQLVELRESVMAEGSMIPTNSATPQPAA